MDVVGHQGAHVRIEVLGYEHRTADNISDANWLTCRVEIRVRGFEARVHAAFTTEDFVAFGEALRSAVADLQGEATFDTDEEVLQLDLTFNCTGSVSVTGIVRDPDDPATSLEFAFESDQTFMANTVAALNEITNQFPVRT